MKKKRNPVFGMQGQPQDTQMTWELWEGSENSQQEVNEEDYQNCTQFLQLVYLIFIMWLWSSLVYYFELHPQEALRASTHSPGSLWPLSEQAGLLENGTPCRTKMSYPSWGHLNLAQEQTKDTGLIPAKTRRTI